MHAVARLRRSDCLGTLPAFSALTRVGRFAAHTHLAFGAVLAGPRRGAQVGDGISGGGVGAGFGGAGAMPPRRSRQMGEAVVCVAVRQAARGQSPRRLAAAGLVGPASARPCSLAISSRAHTLSPPPAFCPAALCHHASGRLVASRAKTVVAAASCPLSRRSVLPSTAAPHRSSAPPTTRHASRCASRRLTRHIGLLWSRAQGTLPPQVCNVMTPSEENPGSPYQRHEGNVKEPQERAH